MSDLPEVVILARNGEWWYKSHQDVGGWWWCLVGGAYEGSDCVHLRYSQLPEIVETYQPSRMIHELARAGATE